ncbi:NADPH-dependent FMN reductase [Spiribacter vilamensis]|uniref:NAD(P)H-dependent FMN reductase n=1 Tax=Spiribacter vilamensis TaxID=531306 RepID=A0A4Q8CZ25_9GAMM|nr:NAD(P)H-dependent oxidoreductase [Spiribacter vilamensis]RZU98212.1 NAD(P)H-dependent FMN reductase [Spiribacter vilamensis]TVO60887.1 NAD(P)H-dependent oxidoreductase [Spiribacter vilamensis]
MTDQQLDLITLAGSTRKASVNKKLARLARDRARHAGASVEFLDLADYPLPLYDGDLEDREGIPAAAQELKARLRQCDGFLIASPEYNSSLSPVLKNALDWISRRKDADEPPLAAYRGKVAALVAASPGGLGGLRGLVPLRMMLGNIGVHVIPDQFALAGAFDAFNDADELADPKQAEQLSTVVEAWVATAARLKQHG